MTFTSFQQATWGQALADLRDQIAAETNWTIAVDDAAGSALTTGDRFIIQTPASDSGTSEYISFELEPDYGGVALRHGTAEDGITITDRWQYDPVNARELHDDPDVEPDLTVLPRSDVTFSTDTQVDTPALDPGMSGSYWATTVARGFGFYFQREEADGNDGDCFIGMCEAGKAWNYHNADREESEWILGFGDTASSSQRIIYMSNSGVTVEDDTRGTLYNNVKGNNDYDSRGNVNPDSSFDNYPVTNNVVSTRQWRNLDGQDIVIGTFNLWGQDRSASDTGHRDLIVDSGDNPVFTVLKRTDTPSIILRQS